MECWLQARDLELTDLKSHTPEQGWAHQSLVTEGKRLMGPHPSGIYRLLMWLGEGKTFSPVV